MAFGLLGPTALDDSADGQKRLFRNSKSKILAGLGLPVASGMSLEFGWDSEKKSDQWNFMVWQWHDICSDAHNTPPQKQNSEDGERK